MVDAEGAREAGGMRFSGGANVHEVLSVMLGRVQHCLKGTGVPGSYYHNSNYYADTDRESIGIVRNSSYGMGVLG